VAYQSGIDFAYKGAGGLGNLPLMTSAVPSR